MANHNYLETVIQAVKLRGIETKKPVLLSGTAASLTVGGNLSVAGTTTFTGGQGATTITATSANALAVGSSGTTNPALQVDTSGGVTDVTGLYINSNAAGSGANLAALSSGTNENLTIDAKGTGTLTLNGTATGIVILPAGSTIGGSVPLTSTITSSSATAFQVGPNGATNPIFNINANTASAVAGINITGAATGGTVAITTTDSGSNTNLSINSKGTGTLNLQGGAGTGQVQIGAGTIITATGANALDVGRTGQTNPALQVSTSTGTQVTGVNIVGNSAASGVAINTISSGTNENMTIAAKGTGTITFNPAVVASAGGSTADGIQYGSLGVGLFTGTGAPTFSAMNGSLYTDSNATTTTTRVYVNKSGAGTAGTTWTAFTSAA